jgi:hypothetical protein
VLTERLDNTRSALNLSEAVLNKSNVKNGKFGLAFRIVDNLYLRATIGCLTGKNCHHPSPVNVVVVATEHNSAYATTRTIFHRARWAESTKRYRLQVPLSVGRSLRAMSFTPNRRTSVWTSDKSESPALPTLCLRRKIRPRRVIFVVAKSKSGNSYVYKLFSLRLDGKPLGDPQGVTIEGQVQSQEAISFDPVIELNRPALLVDNGAAYRVWRPLRCQRLSRLGLHTMSESAAPTSSTSSPAHDGQRNQ